MSAEASGQRASSTDNNVNGSWAHTWQPGRRLDAQHDGKQRPMVDASQGRLERRMPEDDRRPAASDE
jgi:hypothetical protein